MNTITANVRVIDKAYDESGPLLLIRFEALDESGEQPVLACYVCGPAAETLKYEFQPGHDASIEMEPSLGMDFGRLVRFGIRHYHDPWGCGKTPKHSPPFANSAEYGTIRYVHMRKTTTTIVACFPPYGYEDPGKELESFQEGESD